MDINLLLAILGIISTIVIGYVGVIYTIKFRNNVRLSFLKQECISLLKDIVERVEDIEISFNKKPIGQNVILFKGSFLNSGNTDIDKTSMYEPLSVILPNNYKWLKLNSKNKSDNINLSYEIKNDKTIEFNWDLFKKGEFFQFDALVEYKILELDNTSTYKRDISDILYEEIKFQHRITNLFNIDKGEIKETKFFSRIMLLIYGTQILIPILFIIAIFINPSIRYAFGFETVKNNIKYELKLKPIDNKNVKLNIEALNSTETLTIDKLNTSYEIQLNIKRTRLFYNLIGVSILLIIVYGYFFISKFYEIRKSKRLNNLIKNQNNT